MDAAHIRAGRALLRWSQADLGQHSGVSAPTIKRLEAMEGELTGHSSTLRAIEAALEVAGVKFIDDGANSAAGGPGVRLSVPTTPPLK